ncbi:MAG: EboA domain-containing protein [Rubrivivax sp.]|nr:EboA domain-containing protein [Rubrivivax sp.]
MTPVALLRQWLEARLPADASAWLREAAARLEGGRGDRETERDLYRDISLVARRCGKAPLGLSADERAAAQAARTGWDPSAWTVDQAARIVLLLATGAEDERFAARLDQLCATADVDELVAFYRGLPLYPDASRHRARAAEGVRSNMKVVFEAVAHHSPYAAEQLPEEAWNQMVLKTLFVGSALHPVQGLDARANPALARMLSDYAHERWAARRTISPELWRCIGPFAAGGVLLQDLARVLDTGTPPERAAALLALREAPGDEARALRERHAARARRVAEQGIGWATLSRFNE